MDLPKVFDCIPQDLLVAKSYAYDQSLDAVLLSYSY